MSKPLAEIPVTSLRGVGPSLAGKLLKLGIYSVEDVLFHLPLRYQDRTRITPIGAIQTDADIVVEGTIKLADIAFGKRRSLVIRMQDGTGTVTLRFFYFSSHQKNNLKPGVKLRCFGQARRGSSGLEFYHPEYELIKDDDVPLNKHLTAIYPTTEGVGQKQWRNLCSQAIKQLQDRPPADLIGNYLQSDFDLVSALHYLHNPPADAQLELLSAGKHPAQIRLIVEELAAHRLAGEHLRQLQKNNHAPLVPVAPKLLEEFSRTLAFTPTDAQSRVVSEICAELSQTQPMMRLVQGDVGSGKTLVAAMATLQVVSAGFQVAFMAPTELLAEQHLASFQLWFKDLPVNVGWLSGRTKGKARERILSEIAENQIQLLIGTHAIFQEKVSFKNLGMVIVDEQHRFGVQQRLSLNEKANGGYKPHQLVMTATPIPRSLFMVAYANFDCSIIDELPPGRKPVSTVLIDSARRDQVASRVKAACESGKQAYWVCTQITEDEESDLQAAEATFKTLHEALPELTVGLVHGKMKPSDKLTAMHAFKAGEIDVLVATTVIEGGVDVPNASIMVIENPERLGLAQLHQLRGRVGRGPEESYCVLLFKHPLSSNSHARLRVIRDSNDGFHIAEQDFKLRGPGVVHGTKQVGYTSFKVASFPEHEYLLSCAESVAESIQSFSPDTTRTIIERWCDLDTGYADV